MEITKCDDPKGEKNSLAFRILLNSKNAVGDPVVRLVTVNNFMNECNSYKALSIKYLLSIDLNDPKLIEFKELIQHYLLNGIDHFAKNMEEIWAQKEQEENKVNKNDDDEFIEMFENSPIVIPNKKSSLKNANKFPLDSKKFNELNKLKSKKKIQFDDLNYLDDNYEEYSTDCQKKEIKLLELTKD